MPLDALDFPNGPSVGMTYSGPNGVVWRWDGVKWINASGPGGGAIPPSGGDGGGGGGGSGVTVSGLVTVANVAALRAGTAATLGSNPVLLAGYHQAGDDGGGVYIIGASFPDNGGTYIRDADGRTWALALNGAPVSVTQFGAFADSLFDSTDACQRADTWSRENGSYPVRFPPGIRVRQLVIHSGSNWEGSGRAPSIAGSLGVTEPDIKQLDGVNGIDVIYGWNTAANMGADVSAVTDYVDGYTLRNLTIDGNWNGGAGNTGGGGLWIFGCKPILDNVFITNCATYGMYTGWTHQDPPGICPGFNTWTMEGYMNNVQIDTCGQHGWWNDGPHDTIVYGMRIVDAGRESNNNWDGVFVDSNGGGILMHGAHVWTRHATSGSATVRTRYAVNCDGGPSWFHGCYFEGAYTACLRVTGYATADGCIYGNPYGGRCIQLEGSGNVLRGSASGTAGGAPPSFGVELTGPPGSCQDNIIDLECDSTDAGAVNFGSGYSGGGNYVRIRGIFGASETYSGTPHVNDDIRMNIANTDGQGVYSNAYQHVSRAQASAIGSPSGSSQTACSMTVAPGTWRIWGQAGYVNTAGSANLSLTNSEVTINGASTPGTSGLQNVMLYNVTLGVNVGILETAGHAIQTFYAATTLALSCTPVFTGSATMRVFGNLHAERIGGG